ncbi:MAG TPA: N-6 DNA methylase, partial [Vicinamibacterales bacterium]
MRAVSGSLLSVDALERVIGQALGTAMDPSGARVTYPRLAAWHRRARLTLGPACGARAVFDTVAEPLFAALGFTVSVLPAPAGSRLHATLASNGNVVATSVVTPWGQDASSAWREAVRLAAAHGARWCLCVTGLAIRAIDAERTYSRRFAQFDLDLALDDPSSFDVIWGLLRAGAFARQPPLLDRAIVLSEQHRTSVRMSLQEGVHDALLHLLGAFARSRGRGRAANTLFDESLVVVYRVLFLLFAEARGLVPHWHPIYRDGYTIEALRPLVESGLEPHGLWESVQAIARLAHRGCRAGSLRVPPFNGRLFSPRHAPLADSAALDDGAVRDALLALTTRKGRGGRERIAYGDLGVEQLGGVYERVLDFEPAITPGGITLRRSERRKSTGSFYTPRALTEFIVRRALAPLVRERSPEQILALRVLDPAMGSGAFLVAACRFMASAYERALIDSCGMTPSDVSDAERASFRRTIAQRCLFGVDVNPMAVQLGRLSLWLATLSGDRPLTFLDHHLRAGNSLAGASLADIARPPAARTVARELPLFDTVAAESVLQATVGPRLAIAMDPGDTIEQVRAKEQALAGFAQSGAPIARWRAVADLWCSAWFGVEEVARRGVFRSVADAALGRCGALPGQTASALLGRAGDTAERERFFHWTLEFPEVFYGPDGAPLRDAGFDAVIGNPPWEVIGTGSHLTKFARASGTYDCQGTGHVNLFQLFVERALALTRAGGRIGLVLPSGFASDHGCATLRRRLLDGTGVDTFTCVENRDGLFPIHRSLKFLLLTTTVGGSTATLPCRFGVRSPDMLERLADEGADPDAVQVSRRLVAAATGEDQLAIPDLRTMEDARILSAIVASVAPLGSADGWNVRFGRELNATDDKRHFVPRGPRGLPVVQGKHLQPFVLDTDTTEVAIPERKARELLP